jgi:hypothetical protein
MDQYYETAAFFAQVDLKRDPASGNKNIAGSAVEGAKPLYEIVSDKTEGEVTHLLTKKPVPPKVPYDTELASKVDAKQSRRAQFADWMTSPENDYFAMSYTNRIWGYLTGTGIIEPIDDIRAGNPPTNPELLQYLTNEFVQSGFNVRHLMRLITKSRTYQLSLSTNPWNEDDTINYSHAKARRLPAEVLFDSVFAVTGSMPNIPGVAKGTRAAQLADGQAKLADGFLANFGKPPRESVCECERSNDVNLGPIMALMSGPTVGDAISDGNNAIAKLVEETPEDHTLIEAIFLRVLNRKPTGKEVNAALAAMAGMGREHQQLSAEWSTKEDEQKPIIAKDEKARLELIAATKSELEAHRKKIAPDVAKKEAARKAAIEKAEAAVKAVADAAPASQPRWENYLDLTTEWEPLDLTVVRANGVAKLEKQPDGSLFATPLPEQEQKTGNYQLRARTKLTGITGIKLELLPDDRLPNNGPGLAPDGNFVLSEFKVTQKPVNAKLKNPAPNVGLTQPVADYTQKNFNLALALKANNRDKGWAISSEQGYRHEAIFTLAKPVGFEGGTDLTIAMIQAFQNGGKYNIGRFRVWVTRSPSVRFGVPAGVAAAMNVPAAKRSKEEKALLQDHYLLQDRGYQAAKKRLVAARKPVPVDPQLIALEKKHVDAQKPIVIDPKLVQLRRDTELSKTQLVNKRLTAAQDLTWALINSPAFLFNH